MSKFNRVAKMGSSNSKYGQQRNEFEKGDAVQVDGGRYVGIVTKATAREVIINVNGSLMAFLPRYVEVINAD